MTANLKVFELRGTLNEIGCHQLGYAILADALTTAAIGLLGRNTGGWFKGQRKPEFVAESIAFVQGSGLEVFTDLWGFPLNAERIREAFDGWVIRQRRK